MAANESLHHVEIFKYLTADECERVLENAQERAYRKGDVVFQANSIGNEMFIIKNGRVKVFKVYEGNEITFAEFGPGDVFGEMSLIDEYPRSASIGALEDCSVLCLSRAAFKNIVESAHPLGAKLLLAIAELFSKRMRKTDKQLETLHLVNKALMTNDEFRQLYTAMHA